MSSIEENKGNIDEMTKIKQYLNRANLTFEEYTGDLERFNFVFNVKVFEPKITVTIGQEKSKDYEISVVNVVRFSPQHLELLEQASKEVKASILDDFVIWFSTRELNFHLELHYIDDPTNPDSSIPPHYVLISPIYEGELSFASLMRAIQKVAKCTLLANRHIHIRLNQQKKLAKKE